MNTLHFSDNLIKLRQQKKLTQEQLAAFVGVTKASVSKWETGQSLPDILLLPKLAAFFDISIDELLGYEPALSNEQIQKLYSELVADFAAQPFEAVMEKSRALVKNYYSCYPFLFQICCLWLNHAALPKDTAGRNEILAQISDLCEHILTGCSDIGLCNDTTVLKAAVDLQLGNIAEVTETLEELMNPRRLTNQSDSLLIEAYRLGGDEKKADSYTQISMYLHLISLAASSVHFLALHSDSLFVCEETIRRMEAVFDAWRVMRLHPNTTAQFWYQAAMIYAKQKDAEKTLEYLERYAACIDCLFKNDKPFLHGDDFFCQIEPWFEQSVSGAGAPRDQKLVLDSALQILERPAFAFLSGENRFKNIKDSIKKKGERR